MQQHHIAYYAPWGNLAIFYRDFPRSPGLVILGHINGPLDALTHGDGEPTVTIEETP
ncbi:cyclophilin-like fold protein [Corynebacterium variabile]|uniref:cyclophilin-like fold protein n=1 Tax=Corynebacterium variabile TaxID=1727 RepID=UPI0037367686